jgi:DNA repair exonuclease SbcCD ATPase subunit
MKEVKFKQVAIRNFLSVGNDPITIDFAPGIHIITGVNKDKEDSKNGVGKSTISDAIFFAIFGSPLRPIKKDVIPNWINKSDCCVSITFDVIDTGKTNQYKLTRSLAPSKVRLEENGEDISRTIGKTNQTVHEILGTDAQMFEQSVIMCLNQVDPFLAKTPAVKRKFIEDIFRIEIFGKMTQHMRGDYNEANRLHEAENDKLHDLNGNVEFYKKQQQEQKEKKKARISTLEARKKDALDEIKHITEKIENIKSGTDIDIAFDGQAVEDKINKLKKAIQDILKEEKEHSRTLAVNQTTILNIKKTIEELENLTEGTCAHCKQPFSESNIKEKHKLISEHKKHIKECDSIVKTADKDLKDCLKNKSKIEDLIDELAVKKRNEERKANELKALESEIQQQNKNISTIEEDLLEVINEKDSFTEAIEEYTSRLKLVQQKTEEYKDKIALVDTSKFIVSDEGVKNFIVKKMLKMLNGRLNYYLKQLDANCTCKFNEYFDEIIVNNRNKECSYFNFSGGERKRIDLAMLFTFMDIRRMQSNISVNIAIYDELLDTSLDAVGIENTLQILKDRALNNNEAIYIISHKNEAAKHATGEIIYLEKENDITKRKTYE